MGKRGPEPSTGASDAWMATFADLLMLMLTFFVLLLSMSSLEDGWQEPAIREGLHREYSRPTNAMVPDHHREPTTELEELLREGADRGELDNTAEIEELMLQWLDDAALADGAWLDVRPDGISIEIDGQLGFEPGSWELTPELRWLLGDVALLLGDDGIHGVISAFVADSSESLDDLHAAWELALLRADVVAQFLIVSTVAPEQLQIMGYGRASEEQQARWAHNDNAIQLELVLGGDRPVTHRR